LWEYLEDGKLFFRLNQDMRRVKLPAGFANMLATARPLVSARRGDSLSRAGRFVPF
jgi:hypothetical protein